MLVPRRALRLSRTTLKTDRPLGLTMRQAIRKANLPLKLVLLGAAGWSIWYSGTLAWAVLISDVSIGLKLLAIFGLLCWYVLHYASGCLDAIALMLGMVGYGLVRLGTLLASGKAAMLGLGERLARVLSDESHTIADQELPVGSGATSIWGPKQGLLVVGSLLSVSALAVLFWMISARLSSAPQHVAQAQPGLSGEIFKSRYFGVCIDCGGAEVSKQEAFEQVCLAHNCDWRPSDVEVFGEPRTTR
jgi:hypothetical protein